MLLQGWREFVDAFHHEGKVVFARQRGVFGQHDEEVVVSAICCAGFNVFGVSLHRRFSPSGIGRDHALPFGQVDGTDADAGVLHLFGGHVPIPAQVDYSESFASSPFQESGKVFLPIAPSSSKTDRKSTRAR